MYKYCLGNESTGGTGAMAHENPLRVATEHAQAGRTAEAIACLELELARTRSSAERPANVPILAKTAGLLCEQSGTLQRAAHYYEEAVAVGDPDPLTLVALADVHWRLGRADSAVSCLTRAESLAKSSSDADTLTVIANMRARWASGP